MEVNGGGCKRGGEKYIKKKKRRGARNGGDWGRVGVLSDARTERVPAWDGYTSRQQRSCSWGWLGESGGEGSRR